MNTATGRAAVLDSFGAHFEVREFPVPEPAPGAIVAAIDVATVCGSDLHIWEGQLGGTYTVPMPLIIGHEMVGRVVSLAPAPSATPSGRRWPRAIAWSGRTSRAATATRARSSAS